MIVAALQAWLALLFAGYSAILVKAWPSSGKSLPKVSMLLLGAITNFFDTLGIGNFAPTTVALRATKQVDDELIPGTLHAGHCLPGLAQAIIFLSLIEVDVTLLICCMVAAILGGSLGARLVSRLDLRSVRLVMGVALVLAAVAFSASNLGIAPGGGTATSLSGASFAVAVGGHAVLGAMMAAGVGFFAPSLVLLSLLGLDPKAVFPIMMTSSAALMPFTAYQYLKTKRFSYTVAIALAMGGIPAVLFAAFVVKEMPLELLRWLVVVVVAFAGVSLLVSGLHTPRKARSAKVPAA
jgi:uncharacterized membrane protein YfcA